MKGTGPFMFDVVVRGGTLVTPGGLVAADVGVIDGDDRGRRARA